MQAAPEKDSRGRKKIALRGGGGVTRRPIFPTPPPPWPPWGGKLLVEKTFSGQHLCSCAFGANIRSYTKQRARHGTPFLQPPPPPSAGVHVTPPPPPAEQFSGRPVAVGHLRAFTQKGTAPQAPRQPWGGGRGGCGWTQAEGTGLGVGRDSGKGVRPKNPAGL